MLYPSLFCFPRWLLGGGLVYLFYVSIYFISGSFLSLSYSTATSTQRTPICYDENPPLFPRIDTKLIRRVSTEPRCGFGVAPSTVCDGSGLFDIDVEVKSGERFLPFGGIPPPADGSLFNGDYVIWAGGVFEDDATCGLGRYCNDRLHPDLCNAMPCLYQGKTWLKAIMDIFPGDEITIYYGWDYWKSRTDIISPYHADQISKLRFRARMRTVMASSSDIKTTNHRSKAWMQTVVA